MQGLIEKNTNDVWTVDARGVAKLLGASERHIRTLDAEGKLPAPIQLGRLKKWNRDELRAWMESGCPDRETWQTIRSRQLGRI